MVLLLGLWAVGFDLMFPCTRPLADDEWGYSAPFRSRVGSASWFAKSCSLDGCPIACCMPTTRKGSYKAVASLQPLPADPCLMVV